MCAKRCGILRLLATMEISITWLIRTTRVREALLQSCASRRCYIYIVLLVADQGKINAVMEEIFHIKTGFIGKLVSNLARVRLADVVNDANEKHMQPWADLCAVRPAFTFEF